MARPILTTTLLPVKKLLTCSLNSVCGRCVSATALGVRGLINNETYRVINEDSALVTILREAIHDALTECAYRSHTHRWNCVVDGNPRASREYAYFLALSTASAVRSIARACAMGRLRSCSCDPSKAGPLLADQHV
uniref:Protein Wnt n=1 Tax=Parascaris equorum TaxID=6256 RepID=A0A914RYJ6_PAREQ